MSVFISRTTVALFSVLALAACDPVPAVKDMPKRGGATSAGAPTASAEQAEMNAYARALLNAIQPRSIAENKEYCGYIYVDFDGELAHTGPIAGSLDGCDLPYPDRGTVASWHTHGAFSDRYDNEVPSLADMESDLESDLDGYISTPAGRVWLIDHETRIASQLCGAGCVYDDPRSDPEIEGFIPVSFTLSALRNRFN